MLCFFAASRDAMGGFARECGAWNKTKNDEVGQMHQDNFMA